MALRFYEDVAGDPFSDGGLYTNPCIVSMDGRSGGVIEKRFYVANDDVSKQYATVTLEPDESVGSVSYIDGSSGFSIKMYAGADKPTAAEWATISAGAQVSLPDIPDDSTFVPFWVRLQFPPGIAVQHISDVTFKIGATESLAP